MALKLNIEKVIWLTIGKFLILKEGKLCQLFPLDAICEIANLICIAC